MPRPARAAPPWEMRKGRCSRPAVRYNRTNQPRSKRTRQRDSMSGKIGTRTGFALLALGITGLGGWLGFPFILGWTAGDSQNTSEAKNKPPPPSQLETRFTSVVQPFVERYCLSCHGPTKPKAGLDLSRDRTATAVASNAPQWQVVLDRIQS